MFDKDLERALWFILESDPENRNEIIELLKRLPKEIMETIKASLSSLSSIDEDAMEDDENLIYKGSVTAEDGMVYSFSLLFNYNEKTLEIKQELPMTTIGDNAQITFGAELLFGIEDRFLTPDEKDDFWVGDYTKSCSINTTEALDLSSLDEKFIPYVLADGIFIESGGYIHEQEFEYSALKSGFEYDVVKIEAGKGQQCLPVDILQAPARLTMEYINNRYGDDPKKKEKMPPGENI